MSQCSTQFIDKESIEIIVLKVQWRERDHFRREWPRNTLWEQWDLKCLLKTNKVFTNIIWTNFIFESLQYLD